MQDKRPITWASYTGVIDLKEHTIDRIKLEEMFTEFDGKYVKVIISETPD